MYESIGSAVGAFSSAAMSGTVSIEADAAEEARTEIGKVKDELGDLLRTGVDGAPDVQLGANPVGMAMAQKSVSRYDGGDSFMAALRLLLDQTEQAENALNQCIRNYVDTDSGHAANFRGSHE